MPAPLVLLLGGTSDSGPIAQALVRRGLRVLVSQATEVPVELPEQANIERRQGPLDATSLAELIRSLAVAAVVDAGHPYAAELHATTARVAQELGIARFAFVRPGLIESQQPGVRFAPDHAAAAREAFVLGCPVLLTVGSKNLAPYARQSHASGVPLIVRVLDRPESLDACRAAGIPAENVLAGRGPFSVEENRRQIRRFQIGVLVTKDSGRAGGIDEKLSAASEEGCQVIVVRRPEPIDGHCYEDVEQLAADVAGTIAGLNRAS